MSFDKANAKLKENDKSASSFFMVIVIVIVVTTKQPQRIAIYTLCRVFAVGDLRYFCQKTKTIQNAFKKIVLL